MFQLLNNKAEVCAGRTIRWSDIMLHAMKTYNALHVKTKWRWWKTFLKFHLLLVVLFLKVVHMSKTFYLGMFLTLSLVMPGHVIMGVENFLKSLTQMFGWWSIMKITAFYSYPSCHLPPPPPPPHPHGLLLAFICIGIDVVNQTHRKRTSWWVQMFSFHFSRLFSHY